MRNIQRNSTLMLVVAAALALTSGCVIKTSAPPQAAGSQQIESVAGTTWAGPQSEGDHYSYTFDPNGTLHYSSPSGSWSNGTWKQEGAAIYFETNGRYAEYRGTISGRNITGTASNVTGKSWTWQATKQ